ncbi:type II toxin-antitoxin system HicB family antitoxin [Anaerosinus massiliensis]|uniref:type II toxin-antitoxin system HicB family antitoxin n=1 Tax=Massilibacillus massiliensis TaxID=1806837 RepID=UPI000ADF4A0C|nr:type II toxin-antitoxin system HicB family antitoxin [Massilibacillus massiliensis]
MKAVYPIVITKYDNDYVVYVPDFDINTQGDSVVNAIEMARDAIGVTGCYWEDEKKELPNATTIESIEHKENDIVTLVDIDFSEYRRKNDMRMVRKNVTIPSWLNEEAENANINFSQVLQAALLERVEKRV